MEKATTEYEYQKKLSLDGLVPKNGHKRSIDRGKIERFIFANPISLYFVSTNDKNESTDINSKW